MYVYNFFQIEFEQNERWTHQKKQKIVELPILISYAQNHQK